MENGQEPRTEAPTKIKYNGNEHMILLVHPVGGDGCIVEVEG